VNVNGRLPFTLALCWKSNPKTGCFQPLTLCPPNSGDRRERVSGIPQPSFNSLILFLLFRGLGCLACIPIYICPLPLPTFVGRDGPQTFQFVDWRSDSA
jgi:hypothetical protein